ncbi:MAG: hypothetical protein RIT45_119 [Pseudomonadota bacterium]|jgi:hypothetical protein
MPFPKLPRRLWLPGLAALVVALTAACGPVYYANNDGYYAAQPTSQQDATAVFSDLGAYGTWSWSSRWGRVWIPYANRTPGWRPYTVGQWSYTEYGWTWVSAEAWGSGPYHYGRWGWDGGLGGWVWVPGYTWAPAWVVWRSGGGCVGWAPLGPSGAVYASSNYWVFVQHQHIHHHHVHSVIVQPTQTASIWRQTTVIGARQRIRDGRGGAVSYNAGPSPTVVQQWTGRPVQPRQVRTIPAAQPRVSIGGRAPNPGSRGVTPAPRSSAPGYQATPRPSAPGYQPPARNASPGYQPAPRNTSPTYQPPGGNVSPGYRPGPRNASPSYQPAPRQAPSYQPAPRPAPSYQPAPRPAPSYQPAPRPAPSYQPAPRPAPSYQPAPRPAPSARPAPGAAAPRANSSTPYRSQPRANSSRSNDRRRSSSSSSPSSSSSSSRGRPAPSGRPTPRGR